VFPRVSISESFVSVCPWCPLLLHVRTEPVEVSWCECSRVEKNRSSLRDHRFPFVSAGHELGWNVFHSMGALSWCCAQSIAPDLRFVSHAKIRIHR